MTASRLRARLRPAHEVYIGTPGEQLADESIHQSAAPMDQAKVTSHMGYGQYLAAYSSIDFEYTFSSAQEVMIGCHLPGHWAKGMKATIIVNSPGLAPSGTTPAARWSRELAEAAGLSTHLVAQAILSADYLGKGTPHPPYGARPKGGTALLRSLGPAWP